MKKKLFRLMIVIFSLLFFLTGCGNDEKECQVAESELSLLFKAYGFTGEMIVEDAVGRTIETNIYSADGHYTEVVNGEELTFSLSLGYGENPEDSSPEAIASTESLVRTFFPIALEAMWKQPEGRQLQKEMERTIKGFQFDHMTYSSFGGTIDEDSPQIGDYYKVVETNRKAGKPLQGLYDIPIKEMLAKENVIGTFSFHLMTSDVLNEKLGQAKEAKEFLKTAVEKADLTQFPDGKYSIGFDEETESGTYSGSSSNYFYFYVKDGTFLRIDEDYYF